MDNSSRPAPLVIPPGFEVEMQELRRSMLLEQHDPEALRRRVELIEGMLERLKPGQFPAFHTALQSILGAAYRQLPVGDRAANLQKAIACYEQALRFRTPEADPLDYARTQNNLGTAYADLPVGDRAANLQKAIACYEQALRFRTPKAAPFDYAGTQNNLGNAYVQLPVGDRAANLQQGHRLLRAGPPLLYPRGRPPRLRRDPEQPGHRLRQVAGG